MQPHKWYRVSFSLPPLAFSVPKRKPPITALVTENPVTKKDCLLDGFFLVLYDIIDNIPTKYFIKFVWAIFCSAWGTIRYKMSCLHWQKRALTIVLRTNGKFKVWYFSLFELNLKSSDVKVFERAGQHSGPHTKFLFSLTSLPLIWNFLLSLWLKCISIPYILKASLYFLSW